MKHQQRDITRSIAGILLFTIMALAASRAFAEEIDTGRTGMMSKAQKASQLGIHYMETGKYTKAIIQFQTALKQGCKSCRTFFYLSVCYKKLNNHIISAYYLDLAISMKEKEIRGSKA